ncbi:MAG: hypothetical protein P8Y93_05435 [Acidobacteriota bacterium]
MDFAIISRPFDAERGELTAKGTYRRKIIERTFADEIRLLYRRTTLSVGGAQITIPNWFFQALGVTTQELRVGDDHLYLASHGTRLRIGLERENVVRIGSASYRPTRRAIDLGHLLSTPRLWLGNEELVDFAPLEPEQRDRRRLREVSAEWLERCGPFLATEPDRELVPVLLRRLEIDLLDLHQAALLLAASDEKDAGAAVQVLDHFLDLDDGELAAHALRILRRAADAPSAEVRRHAFRVLITAEDEASCAASSPARS